MKIAIDIGNSNIVVGIYNQHKWQHIWRIQTHVNEALLPFYESRLNDLFLENNIEFGKIKEVVISSVVPKMNAIITHLFESIYGLKVYWVNSKIYDQLPIGIHNPLEIGTDLVANAVAAHLRYKKNCIIVDFGTALTFTTVTEAGQIIGVSIVPGLITAIKTLSSKTAQLPEVIFTPPTSALGHNTTTAIQSGIYYGYTGLVTSMVQALKDELKEPYLVVATGGLSNQLKSLDTLFDEKLPNLTLDGLMAILQLISNK